MTRKTQEEEVKYGRLYVFPLISKSKMRQLSTFSAKVDDMFSSEVSNQKNELYTEAKELHPDYIEFVQGEIEELDQDFRFLNRRLIFIKAYTTFEDLLNWFCKLCVPLTKVPFENVKAERSFLSKVKWIRRFKNVLQQLRGVQSSDRGIMKARKYIAKHLNLTDIPNAAWQNITSYNNIVNVLKHMDGDFGDEDNKQVKKAISYIRSHSSLCRLSKHGHELEIEMDFIDTVLTDMNTILDYIRTEMKRRHPKCFNWE